MLPALNKFSVEYLWFSGLYLGGTTFINKPPMTYLWQKSNGLIPFLSSQLLCRGPPAPSQCARVWSSGASCSVIISLIFCRCRTEFISCFSASPGLTVLWNQPWLSDQVLQRCLSSWHQLPSSPWAQWPILLSSTRKPNPTAASHLYQLLVIQCCAFSRKR